MSHILELNFAECNINQDILKTVFTNQNICVCCLSKNVPYIKLSSCKHFEFFDKYFGNKISLQEAMVCHYCHSILQKMDRFKSQVQESLIVLSEQAQHFTIKNKVFNLRQTNTETSSVGISELIEVEIKMEPTLFPAQVKIEANANYDTDYEPPISEAKKGISKTIKKAAKKPKEPHISTQAKYAGKIKIVTLTTEELKAEREADSLKETFLKLPYKCDKCIVGFDHEMTLQDHMEKRHTEKEGCFVCEICKSVLSTEGSFKDHSKRHFRRYECEKCGKRNNTLHAVIKHYNDQHPTADGSGSIETTFTCPDCGFTTGTYRGYCYHRDKHRTKPECMQCGNTFVNNSSLKMHMFTVHKQSARVYACAACDKTYAAKSGLLAHTAACHAPRTAYCAPCRTHYRTEANLRHHLRTHSSHVADADRKFNCDDCGAKFLNKPALKEHIDWLHLNKTKHRCIKCSKVFKNGSALRKHKNYVHEKKRPPRNKICDHCGRGFTSLPILRAHIRTHTGERPLRCALCPAAFAHSAALYNHNKLLHEKQ